MNYQFTWPQVVFGTPRGYKTRTTRPIDLGKISIVRDLETGEITQIEEYIGSTAAEREEWFNSNSGTATPPFRTRRKYYVGQRLSVQPGRGKRGFATIEVDKIEIKKLLEITEEEAIQEGFGKKCHFCKGSGKETKRLPDGGHEETTCSWCEDRGSAARNEFLVLWDLMHGHKEGLMTTENPTVLVLHFHLVSVDRYEMYPYVQDAYEKFILAQLGVTQDDVPRLRSIFFLKKKDEDSYYDGPFPAIVVRTRTGGMNRSYYQKEIIAFRNKSGLEWEEDDIFDNTYMYFIGPVPESLIDKIDYFINETWYQMMGDWGMLYYG